MSTSPSRLPELLELEQLIAASQGRAQLDTLTTIQARGQTLPLYCVTLGNPDPACPAVAFIGGVHGVERIGTQVLLAYLHSVIHRATWDSTWQQLLQQVRLLFIPMVNPGGLLLGTRANPHGVDLMRNAPVEANGRVPWPLGGQRWSAALPWYRGPEEGGMEAEALVLCHRIEQELFHRPLSFAIDCHSGFGLRDRIWFPYARHHRPVPHLAEAFAVRELFNRTYPHHDFYLMEPQSLTYTTHGDLWDHLYQRFCAERSGFFLPFTLEMGSWLWIKKNPRQFFSAFGHFNPILPHRLARVLRRHTTLFDFLISAAIGHQHWLPQGERRAQYQQLALTRWYPSLAHD